MLEIDNYITPATLAEAYDTLQNTKGAVILGGCGYLRLGARKIGTAIDLSGLNISGVTELDSTIEIGSMTTLREIETHPLTESHANGLLKKSVENIVGVQLRSCVTLGGSVSGRYPFSDPITALMALDAELVFHNHGKISLTDFLEGKGLKDILVKIIIPKDRRKAAFESIRKSVTDYAVLNVAVSKIDSQFHIIVGSRPGRATQALEAAEYLNTNGLNEDSAIKAGQLAGQELKFGDNPRGSSAYRQAICPVLVKRALLKIHEETSHAA